MTTTADGFVQVWIAPDSEDDVILVKTVTESNGSGFVPIKIVSAKNGNVVPVKFVTDDDNNPIPVIEVE